MNDPQSSLGSFHLDLNLGPGDCEGRTSYTEYKYITSYTSYTMGPVGCFIACGQVSNRVEQKT